MIFPKFSESTEPAASQESRSLPIHGESNSVNDLLLVPAAARLPAPVRMPELPDDTELELAAAIHGTTAGNQLVQVWQYADALRLALATALEQHKQDLLDAEQNASDTMRAINRAEQAKQRAEAAEKESRKPSEEQRQAILLALAELSLSRPGWNWMLEGISDLFEGRDLFNGFKKTSSNAASARKEEG